MKRKVASRKLKRTCLYCNKSFVKGDVYYVQRVVFADFGKVHSNEYTCCARCNYYNKRKGERYKRFKESGECKHPIKELVWSTIAGEDYVQEPSHYECLVCSEHAH